MEVDRTQIRCKRNKKIPIFLLVLHLLVALEWAGVIHALLRSLESTVSEFGRSIDPFERDLFLGNGVGWRNERSSEGDGSRDEARAGSFQHDEVFFHFTIPDETTHWSDMLVGKVNSSSGVVFAFFAVDFSSSDHVDLLVDLCSVVVSVLTDTSDGVGHSRWMPSANTSDFSKTTMRLSRQSSDAPPRDDTLCSPTLRHGDRIAHVVGVEHVRDWDLVFKLAFAESNLFNNISTVDLNFHDVGFLLPKHLQLSHHLCMANQTDDIGVVLNPLFNGFVLILGLRMLEGLGLVSLPPLIVSAFELLLQSGRPNRTDGLQPPDRLLIADETHSNHWWCFQNGNSLNDFFLVGF